MRIEKASTKDLDEIYEIELECFRDEAYSRWLYRWLLKDKKTIFLKAVVDGRIAGFAVARVEKKVLDRDLIGRIYTLNVRRDFRRMGVGKELMKALERELERRGCRKIVLEVSVENIPAINLYKSLGYRIEKRIKWYYGPRRDAYRAVKQISRG